jgi:hypothetical protein
MRAKTSSRKRAEGKELRQGQVRLPGKREEPEFAYTTRDALRQKHLPIRRGVGQTEKAAGAHTRLAAIFRNIIPRPSAGLPSSIYEQTGNKEMLDVTSVEELAGKDSAEQVRGDLEGSDPGERRLGIVGQRMRREVG